MDVGVDVGYRVEGMGRGVPDASDALDALSCLIIRCIGCPMCRAEALTAHDAPDLTLSPDPNPD